MFGISYPTVKNRLNRIAKQLELVEKVSGHLHEDVLGELEQGLINAEEALKRLEK